MTIENDDRLLVNRGSTSYQIKYEKIKQDISNTVTDGIQDAPSDGNMSGRKDSDWQQIVHNSYSNDDVDAHLNTNLANGGQILSWDGTDYVWVADQTGGGGGSSDASLVSYQYPSGVSRSVESRLRDRVSVKDFGAKGDGSTDDTVPIQAAFDSVGTSGEELYFPAGTYMISNTIVIRINPAYGSSVKCTDNTIIKAMPSFAVNSKFIKANVSDISKDHTFTWDGGVLDGTQMPEKTATSAPDLLTIGEGLVNEYGEGSIKKAVVTNVTFICNEPTYASNSSAATLGNRSDSCLFLAKGQNFHIDSCRFIGPPDAGIYVSGDQTINTLAQNLTVTNCTFSHCPEVGIISKRQFKNHIIANNFFDRCRVGIAQGKVTGGGSFDQEGYRLVVANNILTNSLDTAIEIRNSRYSVVSNNIIENVGFVVNKDGSQGATQSNSVYGVKLSGSSKCIVSNNVIFNDNANGLSSNSSAVGIYLDEYDDIRSNYSTISGNNIDWFSTGIAEGIGSSPEAQNNIITNNQINNASIRIDTNHNGTFYSETDLIDGHIEWGWGDESSAALDRSFSIYRDRPGRPGYAEFYLPVKVQGVDVQSVFSGIAAAANDSYSDLQQFKDAIKQALEGLNNG